MNNRYFEKKKKASISLLNKRNSAEFGLLLSNKKQDFYGQPFLKVQFDREEIFFSFSSMEKKASATTTSLIENAHAFLLIFSSELLNEIEGKRQQKKMKFISINN